MSLFPKKVEYLFKPIWLIVPNVAPGSTKMLIQKYVALGEIRLRVSNRSFPPRNAHTFSWSETMATLLKIKVPSVVQWRNFNIHGNCITQKVIFHNIFIKMFITHFSMASLRKQPFGSVISKSERILYINKTHFRVVLLDFVHTTLKKKGQNTLTYKIHTKISLFF